MNKQEFVDELIKTIENELKNSSQTRYVQETKAPINDVVGPVSGTLIQRLYEKHNNHHSK